MHALRVLYLVSPVLDLMPILIRDLVSMQMNSAWAMVLTIKLSVFPLRRSAGPQTCEVYTVLCVSCSSRDGGNTVLLMINMYNGSRDNGVYVCRTRNIAGNDSAIVALSSS